MLKKNGLPQPFTRLRNDKGRIAARLTAVSPAGSVGASASQRSPPDTRTTVTKRYVILSAKHERIRNTLKGKNGLPQPFTRLRNDKGRIAAHLTVVSPAGSVGASASQRCPPDTRTAMTVFSANFI